MRKIIVPYAVLVCAIAALIAGLAIHGGDSITRTRLAASSPRPRSIPERMLEARQSTARTGLLSQERSARDGDDRDENSQRDAFDKWFYEQRAYPGTTLPPAAVGKANRHADDDNFDERDDTSGPKWRALG